MTRASVRQDVDALRVAGRVAIVIGSTRPHRICPDVARWFQTAVQDDSALRYELLDLADVALPFLDEPIKPALRRYQHQHTRDWSSTVEALDGFVFVFPQYNWGYPAVLKNALDFLYQEWAGKPAACVTYGTRGGGKAAEQLRSVLQGLRMHPIDGLELAITDADVDDDGQIRDPWALLHRYRPQAQRVDARLTGAIDAPE